MIYIFTALYCEAHIFIKQFSLAKNPKNSRFQEFYSESAGIRLTITGVGEIAAAAAVGSTCTEYHAGPGDFLVNIGTCAYTAESGGIFLCNKITEQATGKTFYPDVLYRHNFNEKSIVTGMIPWNSERDGREQQWNDGDDSSIQQWNREKRGYLYDMEAAAVYQAGSYFFGPHQMIFLKIVSDRGNAKSVVPEQVEQRMEAYRDILFDYIRQLQLFADTSGQHENCKKHKEEALIEKLCADMHCSKVMSDSLRQNIRYLSLAGMDYASVIQEMYEEERLPCKDKREGKICFEELKRRLF